jgi:hypothetical protein
MHRLLLALACLIAVTATPAFADPHPKGFIAHKFNGSRMPITEDGITTFQIFHEECSSVDFGDGRGESDCINGTVRSALVRPIWEPMGQVLDYRFDFRIDPAFAYPGFSNTWALGYLKDSWDSRLRLAIWEGPLLHNFLYQLIADTKNGVTFLGNECQSPAQIGEWVSFSMKVRWSGDEKGWIRVSCNDRVIYAQEDVATNQAPHCYVTNICETGIKKDPKSVMMQIGALMWGNGLEWKQNGRDSAFTKIQPDGITVQMRNVAVTKGAELYTVADKAVVKELQEVLTALGCDPGPADGAAGKRTKQAALECRKFPEGTLPAKFTVASLRTFLDLYKGNGVAALAQGGTAGLPDPAIAATFSTIDSFKKERNVQVDTVFKGKTADGAKFNFRMTGSFVYGQGNFLQLDIALGETLKDSDKSGILACGATVATFEDDSEHVRFRLKRSGDNLVVNNAQCILDALPKASLAQAQYIIGNFRDFALSLVKSDRLGSISHEGLELFLKKVAEGAISVGPAPAS